MALLARASITSAVLTLALSTLVACGGGDTSTSSSGAGSGTGGSGGQGGGTNPGTGGSGGSGGTDTTTSSTTTGAAGGTSTSTGIVNPGECKSLGDACTDCTFDQCKTQHCQCIENDSCFTLVVCLSFCTANDYACYQKCFTDNEAGIADAFLLADCALEPCGTVCPLDDFKKLDECQTCLLQSCDNEMNGCVADSECSLILECIQDCNPNDPECPKQCVADFPNGHGDLGPVQSCLEKSCATPCEHIKL